MLNCKDMTRLISDSLDRKISLAQRLELWAHIMMCGVCRRFRLNAMALRSKIRRAKAECEGTGSVPESLEVATPLPSDAKQRIATLIQDELG
jgi:hypothetical protein